MIYGVKKMNLVGWFYNLVFYKMIDFIEGGILCIICYLKY